MGNIISYSQHCNLFIIVTNVNNIVLVIIVYGLRWKKAHKIGGGWGIPVRRAIGIEKGGDCYSLFLLLLMSTKHRTPNNLLPF